MISHAHPESRDPSRVAVLGSRGFIGATLMEALAARAIPTLGLSSADVDLASPAAPQSLVGLLRPGDAVVMLAALTPDKGRDLAALMKNLTMMHHLCAALAQQPCAQLVYFSSDAVYSFANGLVSEETPACPQDLYGAMHHTRELMAKSLANIPLLVLRPTLVYGARDTHNAYGPNRFRRSAEKEGRIQLFGAGEERRDHIHVKDVVELTVRCLRHASRGTLNLATGRSISFHDVARIVAKACARPVELVSAPRANPVTHRHYDVANLLAAFPGYRFIALEEGDG
jgi:nucleoside-diphosphate-sugar epimerase